MKNDDIETLRILFGATIGELCNQERWNDAKEMEGIKDRLIQALESQSEDCISRREAIKKFTYNYKGKRIPDYDCDNWPVQIDIKTVKEMLRELPPVIPQPKMGHWIDVFGGCECSECGCLEGGYSDYCPNCGAKMVEPQERG